MLLEPWPIVILCLSDLLGSAGVDDGGLKLELDLAGAGASVLEGLDDVHGLLVSDLAEDDVLAI